jgi:hypothetical protein
MRFLYSSVSSSLSGAAANCWDDILKLKLSGLKEHKKALLNRILGARSQYNSMLYWVIVRVSFQTSATRT